MLGKYFMEYTETFNILYHNYQYYSDVNPYYFQQNDLWTIVELFEYAEKVYESSSHRWE